MQRTTPVRRALILALGTVLSTAMLEPATAQTAAPYKVPRLASGQPDFSGMWSNASLTEENRPAEYGDRLVMTPEEVAKVEGGNRRLNELDAEPLDPDGPPPSVGGDVRKGYAGFSAGGGAVGGYDRGWLETGDHVMYVGGQPRTSIITTANGRAPARKAGAPAAPQRGGGANRPNQYDSYETRPISDRCLLSFGRNAGPPMISNGTYNNNYTIVQAKDHVLIEVEMVHDARIVRMNSKHRTDGIRPWFGDSIGWYEGDTLVVETVNIPQRQAYQGAWENLKITERFTRVSDNRLHYRFEVEDPAIWDAKWGGEYEFGLLKGRVMEYACHEGNYALPGILMGARVEEARAEAAAKAKK